VISVENTYKMLYPFSPLINTRNLVNSSCIAYSNQPQTWFKRNWNFWSKWPL